jgi:hypothetical protein
LNSKFQLDSSLNFKLDITFKQSLKALHQYQSILTKISFIFSFSPDDESGNVKTSLASKSKTIRDDELQVRLGLFLENNHNQRTKHKQSLSSLGSNNTSPLSTLTNSSEADMSRHEKSQTSKRGCESIGSLLSVSISEHSNASSNSMGRRHSLTGRF